MLYLTQVLNEIKKESNPPKALRAEHLFKLNEAVFNLSEEDAVDGPLAVKLFQAVEKIHTAYNTGKYDNTDSNFFYDYLALLGTMQNQHFFSQKQTEKMLTWIKEVVDTSGMLGAAATAQGSSSKSLEVENEKLRKKLAKLEGAVQAIRAIETEPKAKTKKAKEEPPAKASPVKKGKGKGKYDDYEEEEPVVKGKGKGKAKKEEVKEPASKGKGKGSKATKGDAKGDAKGAKGKEKAPEPKGKGKGKGKVKEEYEEPPSKGKSKGKGKGKSKEEDPPLRKGKSKGKGKTQEEPKGKAKGKGKKGWKSK